MIAADLDTSREVATAVIALASGSAYSSDVDGHCRRLLETLSDPDFPGAIIPDQDGKALRLVAAASPSDWRRLSPVLLAFAGPTLTSFNGMPAENALSVEMATLLAPAGVLVAASIDLPERVPDREAALRAVLRARDTFARAPRRNRAAPEPTSWLLARFQDHLNVGRREAAASTLARLRTELRLDALNLKALQVQLHAAFDEWEAILNLPGFENLVRARRTPLTTALLLEALYRTLLEQSFTTGDVDAVTEAYRERVRALALPMLTKPLPSSLRDGGWRLIATEALLGGDEELVRAAAEHPEALGWLAGLMIVAPTKPGHTKTSLDDARERVVANDGVDSVDAMAAALAALSRLSEAERHELIQLAPFRSSIRALEEESGAATLPASWMDWLERAVEPDFTNALDLARHGSEEWSMGEVARDPVNVAGLIESLNAAQSHPLAAERTAQALPYIVAALQRDPDFPNVAFRPVYASLLTLLAMGVGRASTVYDSSLVLLDAMLAIGTDAAGYRDLVADAEELAGEGFGAAMVYWVFEVVEAFMRAATPDPKARDQLIHRVLARLAPIQGRLSKLQREALRRLSQEFGWDLAGFTLEKPSEAVDDLRSRLGGKRIALYSLVEAASRQAKVALEGIADCVVDCSADHGGTAKLRALAENSDLFVIAWSASKHAATDFIREHRGARPLVYAQGKGVSSLLRAVEDGLI